MDLHFSAEKLITQRKLQGFSQEMLAEKAGINIRSLQRIEKNETKPQPYTLGRLADALGIKIEDLTAPVADSLLNEYTPRQLSLLHYSALSGCIIPLGNIVVPLFLWFSKKTKSNTWDNHLKKIINFQVSWTLYIFLLLVLYFSIEELAFLVFLLPIIAFINIVLLPIYAGIRVTKNKPPVYLLSIHFLKLST